MMELSESMRARETLILTYPELSESVRAGETLTHSLRMSLSFVPSPSFPPAPCAFRPFAFLYPPLPGLPFASRRFPSLRGSVRAALI